MIQNDNLPKEFKQVGKPLYLLSNYFRRLMKNVNDLKWPLYGLSVMLGLDVQVQRAFSS